MILMLLLVRYTNIKETMFVWREKLSICDGFIRYVGQIELKKNDTFFVILISKIIFIIKSLLKSALWHDIKHNFISNFG